MDIVSRVQNLILKPKEEWVKIKAEDTPPMQLITGYAALLAAIPALAQFIGYSLVGYRAFYATVRVSLVTGLLRMIVYYVFTLATVYAAGYIINALAPNFGSKANLQKAMQLAVYSMTIPWVAGILYIFPPLWILATIGGLYGIYVIYLGFDSPMMDTPKDKVIPYMAVSAIVIIVLTAVVGLIIGAIFVPSVSLSIPRM